jgi:hypothetical protein
MLYRPASARLWDTWLVHHDGLWHLFHIRISDGHKGLWNGVSVATSPDLVHFTEVGPVLEKVSDSTWLGTGMVLHVDGRWVMNFSEEQPGSPAAQVIRFAQSRELTRGWTRIPNVQFEPDPRWYESVHAPVAEPSPRWDSIGVSHVPGRRGGEYLGFFTANALQAKRGASGTVGLCESHDAVHWRALPPPLAPGLFSNCEVVEHCAFGQRHYLLFCTNSGAGIRHDPQADGGSGGTHYVVSDAIEGPYRLPPSDSMLQGTRQDDNVFALIVGRPVPDGAGGWLYSHHWASPNQAPNGSWGPMKRLVERGPWQLGLDWWPGNEQLKGEQIASGVADVTLAAQAPFFQLPVAAWHAHDGDVVVHDDGGCAAADWKLSGQENPQVPSGDLGNGRVFECGLRIDEGSALGVWVGTTPIPGLQQGPAAGMGPRPSDWRLAVLLNADRQRVEFVKLMRSLGPSLVVQKHLGSVPWPVARGVSHQLRVLVRGECMEAYVDDRYAHGVVVGEGFDTSRCGFVTDRASGRFGKPVLWRMR